MSDKTLRFGLGLLCDYANLRGKRSYKKHFECGYGFITKKTGQKLKKKILLYNFTLSSINNSLSVVN